MSEELLNTPEQVEEIAQNVENVAETVTENVVEEATAAAEEAMPETEEAPKAPKGPRKMREIENPYANALENFSWDKVSDQNDRYSKDEQARLEEAYSKSFKSIEQGDVITGKVVSINDREVVLNIGFKSDGVINASELRYNRDLKIGDEVEVYVESQEDANGQMQLSHKRALILKSWQRVNEAYDNQEVITGYVKGKTKGGLIVDVFGIEAFLPGSQIDVKQIRDFDVYVGKTMEFKVVKINHDYKNVVVSHKALIEAEIEAQKAEIISRLEVGQILEGTVKNIVSYGAFVDLGGLDGLIHITDLSWGRISHPSEVVQLDQKVNVVILNFEEGKKRIALGLKQLTPQPWEKLDPDLKVGDKVKGKVVVITDYGAFVEVIPGVEALSMSPKCPGRSTCAPPTTSSRSATRLKPLCSLSTAKARRCLWVSSSSSPIRGLASLRNILSAPATPPLSATSPRSASSSNWKRALTALSTSPTSLGTRRSNTPPSSPRWVSPSKWSSSKWTPRTAA